MARDRRIRCLTRRLSHRAEEEVSPPSAPAEPWWSAPWLAGAQGLLPPEYELPRPTIDDDYDYYDDDEEALEAEPVPAPTVAPIDAGNIAERLEALDFEQLKQVADAFSEGGDSEEDLRRNLVEYMDGWANDAADDARDDPEAAREAGRKEAIGFIAEEIASAAAAGSGDDQ